MRMPRPSVRTLPIVALLPLLAAWWVDGSAPGPVVVAPMPIAVHPEAMGAVPETAPADGWSICAAARLGSAAPGGPVDACVVPHPPEVAEASMSTAVRTSAVAEGRTRRRLLLLVSCIALAAVSATASAVRSKRSLEDRVSDLGWTAERLTPPPAFGTPDPDAAADDPIERIRLALTAVPQRVAAAGRETAAVLAHDLRTPLARLRFRLEAALAAPRPRRGDVHRALSECDDLAALLASLLRLTSMERNENRLDRRPVDLAELAGMIHEAFGPSAEDGGRRLRLDAPGPLMAEVDRPLVLQALSNLVDNALLHTPLGTTVTIGAERRGEHAVLFVTDDGPGVPSEQRRRLGERFWRGARTGDGTGHGLGLSTASAVAVTHGGRALFEDAGPGLHASLTFPILEA